MSDVPTPPATTPDAERWIKRAEREKAARKEAERLLEEQGSILYESKLSLERAYANLKLKADETRAILEHMPNCVIITAHDGTVQDINFMTVQKFGLTPAQAFGKPLAALLPDITDIDGDAARAATNPLNPLQTRGQRVDGASFPCEVVATRLDQQSEFSTIWMARDITSRIEAERRRTKLEDELRQAQKLESLGTLAGGVAHELNTPIQFITDNANYLKEAFASLMAVIGEMKLHLPADAAARISSAHDIDYHAEEIPQAITQTLEGLARVTEIVLAVKRFSHPASAAKEANDINLILRTTATVSKNQWKYVADLELDLAPELPPVIANAGELNQVFLNLIINAAHAIEDKGAKDQKGKITVSTAAIDGGVEVRISDTGVGIKAEHLARIFDLFFTTKPPGRGTGQGLALVHTIVKSHGGKVDVETAEGVGTSFVVRIPYDGIGSDWRADQPPPAK